MICLLRSLLSAADSSCYTSLLSSLSTQMEEQVKSALTLLLQSHIPTATARDIDEIVLSYVMGILEDLVEESDPSQAFDSDSFMEMIVAYLPQLEGLDVRLI